MYMDNLISREKLNAKINCMRKEIEDITDMRQMMNTQLKRII